MSGYGSETISRDMVSCTIIMEIYTMENGTRTSVRERVSTPSRQELTTMANGKMT